MREIAYIIQNGSVQLSQVVCLVMLGFLAVSDWRTRSVPFDLLIGFEVLAAVYNLWRGTDLLLMAAGFLTGLVFLTVSFLTREAIGYGDSLAILVLGTYLGIWDLLTLLIAAFSLTLGVSLFLFVRKKLKRKGRVPFFPFLEMAYVLMLVSG